MALDLGELSIALELENDRFRAGLGQAKRELETLPPAAQREMVKVARVMGDEGEKSGGVVAEGMRAGLVRASPLIIAGITGALSVGAPAVLTAATGLFAGIGIAAASQNDEVRAAFAGLRDLVVDSVDDIGQPLADVLPGIADEIGGAFRRMRPVLIDTMSAIVPQVETLSRSLVGLVENALPGLSRAAQNAGPAIDGLGRFLRATGTAVGDFFSDVSDHAPAAGRAFDGLGQVVAELLPVLSELLGEGAEAASTILPLLAHGVGVVNTAFDLLGPAIEPLLIGFAAFKTAGSIADIFENVSGKVVGLASSMGSAKDSTNGVVDGMSAVSEKADGMAEGMSAAGEEADGLGEKAGPLLGAVLSAGIIIMERSAEQAEEWATAIRAGGRAADEARQQMLDYNEAYKETNSGFGGFLTSLVGVNAGVGSTVQALDEAEQSLRDYWSALSPLEQAQGKVAEWTATLADRMSELGPEADNTRIAEERLAYWTGELADEQNEAELALHGVTQAMIDQAAQALAGIDSTFGYQNSLNQLEDAQAAAADAMDHLHDSNEDTRTSTEDVERAQLALAEQSYRTALAFGQQQADMSGAAQDSAEYARIVQETALTELHRLRDAAGPELAGALNQQIAMLEASGVSLRGTGVQAGAVKDRMEDLGLAVQEIPGYHGVTIDAPTGPQQQRIRDLGYQVVTLPNGRVYVTASTGDAEAALAYLSRPRTTVITAVQRAVGSFNLGFATGGPIFGYDSGGPVHGPGTGTSDSIVALGPSGQPNYRLSNNEHVLTAAEVRAAGGHGAVMDLRRDLLANPRRMAVGGSVDRAGTSTAVLDRPRTTRDVPLVQMNDVTISNQGDAIRLAEELNYLGRLGR